ncbi:hypothetical protein IFM89_006042 [Coptis chinensis]|uniref:DYW domain-containing protein n=1 Tax=Coptis chinensis TaxID=261450 RepID=A0A835HXS8_9MAGN|nr:hypothetical protein IFM89_006042 [Coptis chinensis]
MKDTGIKKAPDISSIEVNGSLHEFIMGGRSHPCTKETSEMLNVDDKEKEIALTYHSERLAIASGLISTAPSTPIRIVKNLRVCDDCHSARKLLSKIFGRVIIVRDHNHSHHFCEGFCSSRDFW